MLTKTYILLTPTGWKRCYNQRLWLCYRYLYCILPNPCVRYSHQVFYSFSYHMFVYLWVSASALSCEEKWSIPNVMWEYSMKWKPLRLFPKALFPCVLVVRYHMLVNYYINHQALGINHRSFRLSLNMFTRIICNYLLCGNPKIV